MVILALLIPLVLTACGKQPSSSAITRWEPPALPDTPAGRRAAAFLSVFNTGDQAALDEFITQHMSPIGPGGRTIEDSKRSQQKLYDMSRGLNVYQVEASHEYDVTLVAQFRLTQEWRRMTFYVEEPAPHLIFGIRMEPADAPSGGGAEALT
jgi:hypothetical protein